MCASIRAPTLVIQGTDERLSHVTQGIGLAQAIPGARLELIEGGGHMVNARDPVRVNLLIRDFIARPRDAAADARPREPDVTGTASPSSDGVRIAYEVFGTGDPTIVLLPSTPIIHSRQWKARSPTSAVTSGWSPMTAAATAAPIARRTWRRTTTIGSSGPIGR